MPSSEEKRKKKKKGFQILYFYWSFSSDIVAVKGLKPPGVCHAHFAHDLLTYSNFFLVLDLDFDLAGPFTFPDHLLTFHTPLAKTNAVFLRVGPRNKTDHPALSHSHPR